MSRFAGPPYPALHIGPGTSPEERERVLAEYEHLRAENERAGEERRRLAEPVIASLEGIAPETLEIVGRGLSLAGGPLAGVGGVLRHLADGNVEYATTALACRLLSLAADDELVERLGFADEPPWPALVRALEEIRAAEGG